MDSMMRSTRNCETVEMAADLAPRPAPILALDQLQVSLFTRGGVLPAVDGLSLTVAPGETLAIVGESGCGKSLAALAVMRLLPGPPATIVGGAVRFMGRDLAALSEREMQRVRGREISMIFQDPMTSLNPVTTVGAQLVEAIRRHTDVSHREAVNRAVELLRRRRRPAPPGRGCPPTDHTGCRQGAPPLQLIGVRSRRTPLLAGQAT